MLLAFWGVLIVLSGRGLVDPSWLAVVVLVCPLVSIGALAAVSRRVAPEPLRRGWSFGYRAASALLALAGVAGVVSAAARMVTDRGGAEHLENGPLALLFLISFVVAWPAVARPTPRRAALPAVVIHLIWLPLVLMNVVSRHTDVPESGWHTTLSTASLVGILVFSASTSILALVAFEGTPLASARSNCSSRVPPGAPPSRP